MQNIVRFQSTLSATDVEFSFEYDPTKPMYPFHVEPKNPEAMNQANIVVYAHNLNHAKKTINAIYLWYARQYFNWANFFRTADVSPVKNQQLVQKCRLQAVFLQTTMANVENYNFTQLNTNQQHVFVLDQKGFNQGIEL